VIIQEIFSVNSHIKRVTDGFAAVGYVVLAPTIFDRAERDFVSGYRREDIEATLARPRTLDFLKQYLG
jgi:carboxymethylenebutenolidase